MCVIAAAAKKRHMKRAEVLEAIRHNSAGFFGFTVHDGARRTIRTLDNKEFMEFFDSVDADDPWVMHARIPSRGEKSLDNVHGWEQDGIIFMHNMTLSELDGMMKRADWKGTDSEFFFRHVFIPFYRGCGAEAYKDGKFCQDLDNLVRHFCGTHNKLLFIMPDNRLVRYGDWVSEPDRKEGGECAFYASNSSYKVYERAWPKPAAGFSADDYDYDYGGCDDYGGYYSSWPPAKSAAAGTTAAGTGKEHAEAVLRGVGAVGICKLALCDIVAHGAASYKSMPSGWGSSRPEDDDVAEAVYGLMPKAFTDDTYDAALSALELLASDPPDPDFCEVDFAEAYAEEFGPALAKTTSSNGKVTPLLVSDDSWRRALKRLTTEWLVFRRVAAVDVNWGAKSPASFAAVADHPAFEEGAWRVRKVRATDILGDESAATETVFRAIGRLLKYIQDAKAPEGKTEAKP